MTNPTPDQIEAIAAAKVATFANFLAHHDKEKSVGIILKAFDLLTEDMTVKNKRSLLESKYE